MHGSLFFCLSVRLVRFAEIELQNILAPPPLPFLHDYSQDVCSWYPSFCVVVCWVLCRYPFANMRTKENQHLRQAELLQCLLLELHPFHLLCSLEDSCCNSNVVEPWNGPVTIRHYCPDDRCTAVCCSLVRTRPIDGHKNHFAFNSWQLFAEAIGLVTMEQQERFLGSVSR